MWGGGGLEENLRGWHGVACFSSWMGGGQGFVEGLLTEGKCLTLAYRGTDGRFENKW